MVIDQLEAGRQALPGLVFAGKLGAGAGKHHLVHVLVQLATDDTGPEGGEPLHQLATQVFIPAHWGEQVATHLTFQG